MDVLLEFFSRIINWYIIHRSANMEIFLIFAIAAIIHGSM